MSGKSDIDCSYCGAAFRDAYRFIAGRDDVYICNECVALCNDILEGTEGWTPVSERVPSDGKKVLAADALNVFIDAPQDGRFHPTVTHWRPLPDMPRKPCEVLAG